MRNLPLLMALFVITLMSCNAPTPSGEADQHQHIRFNQVGYYPDALKEFVVVEHEATSFMILDAHGEKTFEGSLLNKGIWEISGEAVLVGNFSEMKKSGSYYIQLNTGLKSTAFEIRPNLYSPSLVASIKSFYCQRASRVFSEVDPEFSSGVLEAAERACDIAWIFSMQSPLLPIHWFPGKRIGIGVEKSVPVYLPVQWPGGASA